MPKRPTGMDDLFGGMEPPKPPRPPEPPSEPPPEPPKRPRRRRGVPFQKGSDTSKAAAESMEPYAANQRRRVLRVITEAGIHGATREEITNALGARLQAVCGRCKELLDDGQIYDSGDRRRNKSGRYAEILVAFKEPKP